MKKRNPSRTTQAAAWFLMLTMAVMLLAGCGSTDTSEQLHGSWGLDYDMGTMISEELGDEYAGFQSPLNVTLVFDFNEDGTYRMYADEEAFRTNWDSWMNAFITYMVDDVYAQIEATGVDRATADQMIQETYGCTAEEYMRQIADSAFDVDAILAEMEQTGDYKAEGEKLFLSDPGEEISTNQYDYFEVKDDKLTLSLVDESQDSEVLPGLNYPLIFTKR